MTTSECLARPDRTEPSTLRCIVCRLCWDRDDESPCPRTLATAPPLAPEPFVSALAPERFGR